MSLWWRKRALLSKLPPGLHCRTSQGELQWTLQNCEFCATHYVYASIQATFTFESITNLSLRAEWSVFSSTGSVTWTSTLHAANPHTPSVVSIFERIRRTLDTIIGKLSEPGDPFSFRCSCIIQPVGHLDWNTVWFLHVGLLSITARTGWSLGH